MHLRLWGIFYPFRKWVGALGISQLLWYYVIHCDWVPRFFFLSAQSTSNVFLYFPKCVCMNEAQSHGCVADIIWHLTPVCEGATIPISDRWSVSKVTQLKSYVSWHSCPYAFPYTIIHEEHVFHMSYPRHLTFLWNSILSTRFYRL